jgi:hypothetical protein
MHAARDHSPLIERSKREVLLQAAPMVERTVQAACGAIEEAERGARSVARRLQLGDAHAALLRHAPRLRAEFPRVLMQGVERALRQEADAEPQRSRSARRRCWRCWTTSRWRALSKPRACSKARCR